MLARMLTAKFKEDDYEDSTGMAEAVRYAERARRIDGCAHCKDSQVYLDDLEYFRQIYRANVAFSVAPDDQSAFPKSEGESDI